jgi:hypothetical protein
MVLIRLSVAEVLRAVRFQGEGPARRAYFAVQNAILETACQLSTYRFLVRGIWHVAVMGEPPPEELGLEINRALRSGDSVELPEEIAQSLSERGKQERQKRIWTERHYR